MGGLRPPYLYEGQDDTLMVNQGLSSVHLVDHEDAGRNAHEL